MGVGEILILVFVESDTTHFNLLIYWYGTDSTPSPSLCIIIPGISWLIWIYCGSFVLVQKKIIKHNRSQFHNFSCFIRETCSKSIQGIRIIFFFPVSAKTVLQDQSLLELNYFFFKAKNISVFFLAVQCLFALPEK